MNHRTDSACDDSFFASSSPLRQGKLTSLRRRSSETSRERFHRFAVVSYAKLASCERIAEGDWTLIGCLHEFPSINPTLRLLAGVARWKSTRYIASVHGFRSPCIFNQLGDRDEPG